MKYMGIDYGSKRVGVALSDDGGSMAFPKKVIQNKGGAAGGAGIGAGSGLSGAIAALVSELRDLCVAEKVDEIVIGDSRDYHGRPNEIMKEIEAFSVVLQEEIKVPVHFQLEFMTSAQASRSAEGGVPEEKRTGKKRGQTAGLKGDATLLDASAAAIILQSFLDKKKA